MHTTTSPLTARHLAYNIRSKPQPSLMLALPGTSEYASLSRHISDVFQKSYSADIQVTYPLLMGFVDAKEKPLAALGIRTTIDESPLFLERYLDQPAEISLQAFTGQRVSRYTIAEAGNLASSGNGDILMLLYGLACHLDCEGISHVLFTGTSRLLRYLHSLNLYPHVLAEADPARLGSDAARWGNYYDTRPKVMAGSVAEFRDGLEIHFRNHAKQVWQ